MAHFKTYSIWLLLGTVVLISQTSARSSRTKRQTKSCYQPENPQNGVFICELETSSDYLICTATCLEGYRFQTGDISIRRSCNTNTGEWDTEVPASPPCIPEDPCPELTAPANGSISCNMVASEKVCSVKCDAGFRFQTLPSAYYTCSKDGVWTPSRSVPDCVNSNFSEISSVTPTTATGSSLRPRPQEAAVCVAWGQDHYRTFDNRVYNFRGACQYLLARDCLYDTFNIHIINDDSCDRKKTTPSSCKREVDVYLGPSTRIHLRKSDAGAVVLWNEELLHVPTSRDGVVFEQVGGYLTLRTSLGVMVKWDGNLSVSVKVSDDLRGKTCGLCGRFDGDPTNDFEDSNGQVTTAANFVRSWQRSPLDGAACRDVSQEDQCRSETSEDRAIAQQADTLCGAIVSDLTFKECHSVVDPAPYLSACKQDCCAHGNFNCTCSTMEAYARACMDLGVVINWRNGTRCPVQCSGGRVFKQCGSSCTQECGTSVGVCNDRTCIDGCFCPAGYLLHAGACVKADQCPCVHADKEYMSGETMRQDCNNCTCQASRWNCTNNKCSATCSAVGDPHFVTFDGKRYDFMGTCSYYLLHDEGYKVILDNEECGGGEASCAKSVTLQLNDDVIRLDHNHQLFLNGREIKTLPAEVAGVRIFMVSSLFMQAELPNNVVIMWDGRTRVYVKAPPSFLGRTQGLCGTFDNNQHNDFLTRDGDTETNVNAFGNKWKTEASCRDVSLAPPPSPCDSNAQRMQRALALCQALKGDVFKACHSTEDVQSYYDNCMYDVCACQVNLQDCLCPSLGQYADTCASQGVIIQWRPQVAECNLPCPGGQQYQVCGNPCERTCRNMAEAGSACRTLCVEGCNCPDGQALDSRGQCVPVTQCPCIFDGREFPSGYKALQEAELCVCHNAKWNCSHISYDATAMLPANTQPLCPTNMHYTNCPSPCPDTCDALDIPPSCPADRLKCQPGCACNAGLVLHQGACVNMSKCPCYHGGKAFYQGDVITMDCNKCTCKNRRWECETKECPAVCSAVGDSHYTTFDGRDFQFQGTCDYVLARSREGSATPFVVSIENVACGTSGVTCSKMVTISVGAPGSSAFYNLRLVRGQSVAPESSSPFAVREVGLFLHVDTPIGLSVQWDHGTRLYVKLSSSHRGQVEGLCGNFNGDQKDDFTTPQGGPPVARTTTFGDSWKMHAYCAPATDIVDTCQQAPHRKPWAQRKCGVLSSDLFRPCHAVEPHKKYFDRCVFDTCACDQGGDCECLCTAIAAYAHVCASKGVLIKWRNNELCPLACEDCKTYNPCITSCPKKTCDNRLSYDQLMQQCQEAGITCSEGCDLHPCPPGQVYDSLQEPSICIPEALCQTPACEVRGKLYREGERVWDDTVCNHQCEICNCRNGNIEHISFGYCTRLTSATSVTFSASYTTSVSNYSATTLSVTPTAGPSPTPSASHPSTPGPELATSPSPGTISTGATWSSNPPSSSSSSPSPLPVRCADGWTAWMSASAPTLTNVGDVESFPALRMRYTFCQEAEMDAIECRVVGRDTAAQYGGQNVTCDLTGGLKCYHRDQSGKMCFDYEVRFFCRCAPTSTSAGTAPVTPFAQPETKVTTVSPTLSPDVSPGMSTMTPPGYVTQVPSGQPATPRFPPGLPLLRACDRTGWTPWVNSRPPDTSGDMESLADLRRSRGLCGEEFTKYIQCRPANSSVSSGLTADAEVVCSTKAGLVCLNSRQPVGSSCKDYEIRVYCDCAETQCESGLMKKASEESLLQLTASSQADPEHAPRNAVLDSASSWAPAADDRNPWFQVDLGYSRMLTGISTRGSPTSPSWVKSYSLEVSSDCVVFRYLLGSDQKPEVFEGNADSTAVITHMFRSREDSVRCVRVHPLEYFFTASLRLELLGCSETFETFPPDTESLPPLLTITLPGYGTEPTPSGSSVTQGPLPVTMPYSCTQGWSRFFNLDTPEISQSYETSSSGDYEILSELRQYYSFCAKPSALMCRTVRTKIQAHLYSPRVTCDLDKGLVCVNALAPEGSCEDFEISFYCDCGEVETTTETVTFQTGSTSRAVPTGTSSSTASPMPMTTVAPTLSPAGTEVVIGHTTQFTGTGRPSPESPGTTWTGPTLSPTPFPTPAPPGVTTGVEEVTGRTMQFTGFERFTTVSPVVSTITGFRTPSRTGASEITTEATQFTGTGAPTMASPQVTTGFPRESSPAPGQPWPPTPSCMWTGWLNFDHRTPTSSGDMETLGNLRLGYSFCERPVDIECRVSEMGSSSSQRWLPYNLAGQLGVTCDLNRGLTCLDGNQVGGQKCLDYEVRVYCVDACTSTSAIPAEYNLTTSNPGSEVPSTQTSGIASNQTMLPFSPSTASAASSSVSPFPACSQGWTSWLNTYIPTSGTGDVESPTSIPGYPATCWRVLQTECRVASSGNSYKSTGQAVTCDNNGLKCTSDNSQTCEDYEARFFCICGPESSSTYPSPTVPASSEGTTPTTDAASSVRITTSPRESTSFPTAEMFPSTWSFDPSRLTQSSPGLVTLTRENISMTSVPSTSATSGSLPPGVTTQAPGLSSSLTPPQGSTLTSGEFPGLSTTTKPVIGSTSVMSTQSVYTITPKVCEELLGVGDPNVIPKDQLTASTARDYTTEADQGRLGNQPDGPLQGAWMPRYDDQDQWIQVDLKRVELVTGVVLQGHPLSPYWVTLYRVYTSLDGVTFTSYVENGQSDVTFFNGSSDQNTKSQAHFDRHVPARYLRLVPWAWHNAIAVRFDVLSCTAAAAYTATPSAKTGLTSGTIGTSVTASPQPPATSSSGSGITAPGQTTMVTEGTREPVSHPGTAACSEPMGVDNPLKISDSQLTASSSAGPNAEAYAGRLFNEHGAWIPQISDENQWLQVDLGQSVPITNVLTQGSPDSGRWVTQYLLRYSNDSLQFFTYASPNNNSIQISANSDSRQVSNVTIWPAITARFWRLVPTKWSPEGIGLRLNLVGCQSVSVTMGYGDMTVTTRLTTGTAENASEATATMRPNLTPGLTSSLPVESSSAFPTPRVPVDQRCLRPMGIDNYKIVSDAQMTSSSSSDLDHSPATSRLSVTFNVTGWLPDPKDKSPWLQVDFEETKILTGILLKESGAPTTYIVLISQDGVTFDTYTMPDGTTPRTFQSSGGQEVAPTQFFDGNVIARFVRVVPVDAQSMSGLRLNLIGCNPSPERTAVPSSQSTPSVTPTGVQEQWGSTTSSYGTIFSSAITPTPSAYPVCFIPMGVASPYTVAPEQLTSSSDLDTNHTAQNGRLYGKGGAWAPRNTTNAWIQVDLLSPKLLSGIVTQGSPDLDRWVTSYIVTLSSDGTNFTPYSDDPADPAPTTFVGNNDSTTPVRRLFNRDLVARYVRLQPAGASDEGLALRFDILGCNPDPPHVPYVTPTPLSASTRGDEVYFTTGHSGNDTMTTLAPLSVCDVPMGVDNPEVVQDYQLRASSCLDQLHCADRGRLYMLQDGRLGGGWLAGISDGNQWIEVDFLAPYPVAGVVTQGHADFPSWVNSYEVYTSTDGLSFYPVMLSTAEDKKTQRFQGNSDQFTPVQNSFPRIPARFVRIRPVDFHGGIGLRFSVLGCEFPSPGPRWTTTLPTAQSSYSTPATSHSGIIVITGQPVTMTGENRQTGEMGTGSTVTFSGFRTGTTETPASSETSAFASSQGFTPSSSATGAPESTGPVVTQSTGNRMVASEKTTAPAMSSAGAGFSSTLSSPETASPSSVSGMVTKFGESTFPGELSTTSTKTFTGFGAETTSSPVTFKTVSTAPPTVSGMSPVTEERVTKTGPTHTGELSSESTTGARTEGISQTAAAEITSETSRVYTITGEWVTRFGGSRPSGELSTGSTISFTGLGTESTPHPAAFTSPGISGVSLVTGQFQTISGMSRVTEEPRTGSTESFTGFSPGPEMSTAAPGQEPSVTTISGSGSSRPSCMYWSSWFSGQTPDAVGEFESFKDMAKMMSVCREEQVKVIQCRTVDSKQLIDQTGQSRAQCDLGTLSVSCVNTDGQNCPNYEIRVFCDECSGSTTSTSSTTVKTPSCMDRWSVWVNRDTDPSDGDRDLLSPEETALFCPLGKISDIECVTADATDTPFNATQLAVSCDVTSGVRCDVELNNPMGCQDFKIRYRCECPGASATPPIVSMPTTAATATFSPCTKSGWSLWVNRDSPDTGEGDREYLTTQELSDLCPGGVISQVDCETNSGVPYYLARQTVECSVQDGFTCLRRVNIASSCSDFRIRYYCECPEYTLSPTTGTERTTVVTPTTTSLGHDTWFTGESSPSSLSAFMSTTAPSSSTRYVPQTPGTSSGSPVIPLASSLPPVQPGSTESTSLQGGPESTSGITTSRVTSGTSPPWAYSTSGAEMNTPSGSVSAASPASASSTELPPLTEVTVITRCSKSSWMQWVNKDIPETGDGDYEFLSNDELSQLCLGGDVTQIECYAGDTPAMATGEINECTLEHGLICKNDANSPAKCSDYKVRYYCECGSTRTFSSPVTSTQPSAVTNTEKMYVQCSWSPWLNADRPNSDPNDPGDLETIDLLKSTYGLCPDIMAVECRVAASTTPASGSQTCDVNNGLRCYNNEQVGGICYDYEIRVLCWSPNCEGSTEAPMTSSTAAGTTRTWSSDRTSTVACQPGYEWSPCASTCDQVCDYLARSSGACEGASAGACIAGCRPSGDKKDAVCPPGQRLRDTTTYTCVPSELCTCLRPDGTEANAFDTWPHPTDRCSRCSCFNGAVRCLYDIMCATTTTPARASDTSTVSSTSPLSMTSSRVQPTCGWSAWLNENTPLTGAGDVETVARAAAILGTCPAPVAVECREAKTGLTPEDVGQKVTCDVTTGLTCYNFDNKEPCKDYEMRVFCPCLTETPSTSVTPTASEPATSRGRTCTTSRWSEWINNDTPYTDGEDREKMTEAELASFCAGGRVTDILCATTEGLPYYTAGDVMSCTVADGAVCKNTDNAPIDCQDYMVRYYCNCTGFPIRNDEEPTTLSYTGTSPSVISSICGWTEWMSSSTPAILGEQETIPDLRQRFRFCATEDITAVECREKASGAPVAGDAGVVCDLRYSGLICQQELRQGKKCPDYEVRFLCEGKDKNCVSAAPTDRNEMTALSSTGSTALPEVSPASPSTVKVCQDPMKDQTLIPVTKTQLTASSSLSRYTGPERSILDTQTQGPYIGGWIPAKEDGNPWIRVDFLEPIEITGVITQGRQGAPMWLTSFNLMYSTDGVRFYFYEEQPGIPRVFSANTDSTTTVRQVLKPISVQHLLLKPLTWENEPALRFAIFGCRAQQPASAPTPTNNSFPTLPPWITPTPSYTPNVTGAEGRSFVPVTVPARIPEVCKEDMGMINGQILDDMITASSFRDSAHAPFSARLGGTGSWIPERSDKEQYIQVDLTDLRYVTGVTVQGRPDAKSYVTSFRLLYSTNGVLWNVYRESAPEDKVFAANTDSVTPVTHIFQQPIRARYVRINPITWEGGIALRFELHGCFAAYPTQRPPEQLNITGVYEIVTGHSPITVVTPFQTLPGHCIVWYNWVDTSHPSTARPDDVEMMQDVITASGACRDPIGIQCRTSGPDRTPSERSGQRVRCTLWDGLVCHGAEQDLPLCFNYEVRVGCLRETQECVRSTPATSTTTPTAGPAATPTPGTPAPCYPGLDRSSCPPACPEGYFCDGRACVPRSECPCDVGGGKVILASQVTQDSQCRTCQCLNGGLICLSKTCSGCPVGVAMLNISTCDCKCVTCSENEFQCARGECLPATFRCDGIIDCSDDELSCASTPTFVPPAQVGVTQTYGPHNMSSPAPQNTVSPTPRDHTTTVSPSLPVTFSPTPRSPTTTLSPSLPVTFSPPPEGVETTMPTPHPQSTLSPTPRGHATTLSPTPRAPTESLSPGLVTTESPAPSSGPSGVTVETRTTAPTYTQENQPGSSLPAEFQTSTSTPPRYSTSACQYVTCPPLHQPTLNPGYEVKAVLSEDGCCERYEALCQPALCPAVENSCAWPRLVRQGNVSNCCPPLECVCPEKCPTTSELSCSQGSQIVEIAEDCNCTRKACLASITLTTPQPGVCAYTSAQSPNVSYHSANSVWSDGPCKTCRCVFHGDATTEASCQVQLCPECKPGEESVVAEGKCCPECRPLGCIVDNITYTDGEGLPSEQSCYDRICTLDKSRGLYIIRESRVKCFPLSELPVCTDDDKKNGYSEDGCCMTCISRSMLPNSTSDTCRACSPRPKFTRVADSVRFLKATNAAGVECTNTEPVLDMTECAGYCDSRTYYFDSKTTHDTCSCCQPTKTASRTVNLLCSDNTTMPYTYDVAQTCACGACLEG